MPRREYNPGQPSPWVPSEGSVPDAARPELERAGIDPDDRTAVIAYYESRNNGPDGLPYWYADWLLGYPASGEQL